jgi:hypothetical protein
VLLIDRASLNVYLEKEKLELFYCILAEKTCQEGWTSMGLKVLSAGMKYQRDDNPIHIQPLRIVTGNQG